MHYQPSGILAASYSDAIYEPVASWKSGWPWGARRGMFLWAAAFSIVILAIALWRPRFAVLWAVVVACVLLVGLRWWSTMRKPTLTTGGKIRIISPSMTQDDDWAFQICHQKTSSNIRWVETTKPVFASPAQLDASEARLICYPNGDPDYLFFNLPAQAKIALLSRRCGPQAPSVLPSPTLTSPLATVARLLYLGAGDRIVGELPSTPLIGEPYAPLVQWPGIIVKRERE